MPLLVNHTTLLEISCRASYIFAKLYRFLKVSTNSQNILWAFFEPYAEDNILTRPK